MRDVLVAGAGPAGLAVALGAARAGLDVLVCDHRSGPIDKACGEGLMPAALVALRELGVDPPGHDIRGITYRRGRAVARAGFTEGPGRGVRRTRLHESMRAAADRAGVPVADHRVREVRQYTDHVLADGIAARYLVAADGLHSGIRQSAGLAVPGRAVARWGLRRHYALEPGSDFVEVTWADGAEVYVTPVADDLVGVAVLSSRRGSFEAQLAGFPEVAGRLAAAEPVSGTRGAGPLRQRVRGRVAGRVLLAGDAAGYLDAITGEGISVALATAADLVDCLVADRPDRYERAWLRTSRRTRLLTGGLLWARHRPVLSRAVVPVAAALPRLFGRTVNLLAN
ncbi:monooxygenase [Amycolatopsis antarctica]|uniref:Monooxygenase n=1 Tax=Amycolatopsis antarctica TaxID=1854586 RepID=A0A263D0S1_9PSEU|nr:NAD(P)/FAD-dependent oxidoreductase [Amycolatopsis antarctica]OZM72054.1 monooxygenase [Amycolatopsis antarctica]